MDVPSVQGSRNTLCEVDSTMRYRALIKKSGDWWIGWLVDLPGVNAQEKSKKELLKSLRIGAEDMLATNVEFEPGSEMTTIEVSAPEWSDERIGP